MKGKILTDNHYYSTIDYPPHREGFYSFPAFGGKNETAIRALTPTLYTNS